MKLQQILKSLLNAFFIYSLAVCISCASKETINQSENGEEASGEMADADSAEGEDLALLEEGGDSEDEWSGDESLAEGAENAEEEQELAALEGELSDKSAQATDDSASEDFSMDGLEGDEMAALETEATAPSENTESGELDSLMDGASELSDAPADDKSTDQAAFEAPVSDTPARDNYNSSDTGFFGGSETPAPRTVVSKVPEIPTQAKDQNGTLLNRYYFVRQGDTSDSVSQLIYGTPQRSGDLARWNRGSWQAGKVVYYASPNDASDYQMRSFYQERGITPESHTLQRGEWLSALAEQKYGNFRSWKEIAVVNGLTSPDSVAPGAQLSLYPKDLSGYTDGQQVAQNSRPAAEAPIAEQQMFQPEQPVVAPPADLAGAPLGGNDFAQAPELPPANDSFSPPAPAEGSAKKKKASATGKLIQKNLFSFAVGGVIVFLLLSLLVINRRKKATTLEEDYREDDTYSPPNKAQRG